MYQIARNCLTDHHDVSMKYPVTDASTMVLSTTLDEDTASKQASEDVLLFRAIDSLPHESKELLVMSKFQGLKYEEISSITGDSVPNIKVKVHRTLIRLKELYFELENA